MSKKTARERLSSWLEQVGKRVREHREAIGLSQEALAARAGLALHHVVDIERGEHASTSVIVGWLALALSVHRWDLEP